jgi:hypothetical protein
MAGRTFSGHAVRRALLAMLVIAVCWAPVATSRAMIGLASAEVAADRMPCHGVLGGELAADADRDVLSASHGCMCTPWCAFTATSASDAFAVLAQAHGVRAEHRPIRIKIAAVDPPFEPPRA